MADWLLSGLPECFLFGSAAEQRRAFWEDDAPKVGAARRRKTFSRVLSVWPNVSTPPIRRSKVEEIEHFFDVTTNAGQDNFTFPRPRRFAGGGVDIVTVRFISEIEIVPYSGGGKYVVRFGVEEV